MYHCPWAWMKRRLEGDNSGSRVTSRQGDKPDDCGSRAVTWNGEVDHTKCRSSSLTGEVILKTDSAKTTRSRYLPFHQHSKLNRNPYIPVPRSSTWHHFKLDKQKSKPLGMPPWVHACRCIVSKDIALHTETRERMHLNPQDRQFRIPILFLCQWHFKITKKLDKNRSIPSIWQTYDNPKDLTLIYFNKYQ